MTPSSPTPARDARPTLTRGAKINLRGYAPDDAVRPKLQELGYSLVSSAKGADVVLLAPNIDEAARKQAQHYAKVGGNVPVMEAADFFAVLDTLDTRAAAPLVEAPRREAVEVTDTTVRILDVVLPRRGEADGRVPPAETFAHLCRDEHLLKAARSVALAALHGVPAVLEGETATAKTTAILWVAHLLGQPVLRLNLNGQTDTTELVGRYVPAGEIVETADGARLASWRFAEGAIPLAMRHGWWVILDEMNLAEPQVLERLNPVLEVPPTLVLSEGSGVTFGPRGDVRVDPRFRLFGTMNPAEYAGRSALSPAFRDRWSLWSFVRNPDDAALAAMLRSLVHGEQPEVPLRGVTWISPRTSPLYPHLAEVPDIDGLLTRLGTFHGAVTRASGSEGAATLGRTRRERYVFTRRSLLAAMRMFATEARLLDPTELATRARFLLEDVVERVYVARVQDEADRAAVTTALRAAGLAG